MKSIIKQAISHAVVTTLYVSLVASFIFYIPHTFLHNKPDTVFAPIVMLMLFVLSAAITGSLVFGKPILWYFEGKKKESITLLAYTLFFFFILFMLGFVLLLIY